MSANRPLWRWWLACAALWVHFNARQRWALNLFGWCVLPEWLGMAGMRK